MRAIERIWLNRSWQAVLLLPISLLFGALIAVRRQLYTWGWLSSAAVSAPVVVVGNLTVGGTGKSPVIQRLAEEFAELGWRPGIVARGYGGESRATPHLLDHQSTAADAGDEPVMHFQQLGLPVCVCPDRALAAQTLVDKAGCTLVLSDDGLQHYGLKRDMEIAVFDESAGMGNGWLLPAGPLREPLLRLSTVDMVLIKERDAGRDEVFFNAIAKAATQAQKVDRFTLASRTFKQLSTGDDIALEHFSGTEVHAVAGIGRPAQFFDQLRSLGAKVLEHPFDDHYRFTLADVEFHDDCPVIVTAKDAVKLRELGDCADNLYALEVAASFTDDCLQSIRTLSNRLKAL